MKYKCFGWQWTEIYIFHFNLNFKSDNIFQSYRDKNILLIQKNSICQKNMYTISATEKPKEKLK